MRSLVGILLGTALGFAACGSGSVEVLGGAAPTNEPATVRAESHRWDRAIIEDDGTMLTVEFVGGGQGPLTEPCNAAYEADVDETNEDIVITVYRRQLAELAADDFECLAGGFHWAIEVAIAEQLDGRTLIDGHDGTIHVPVSEREIALPQESATTIQEEVDTTTTTTPGSGAPLDTQGRLMEWAGSVRLEPWFDGFQFEQTDEGMSGVVALNLDADPPALPSDLPLRSVISRMGQQEWRDLVPSLTDEMEAIGVVGLSYDPFEDDLTVSRSEEVPAGPSEAEVADRVRTLLGDDFDDVEIIFDIGTGTDFKSPPTTR